MVILPSRRKHFRQQVNTTILLLHCNGDNESTTITDSALGGNAPHTLTCYGDAKLTTAQKKFGSAALTFDGTGDYVKIDDAADLTMGTDNWTLEMQVRLASLAAQCYFCTWYQSATAVAGLLFNNTQRLRFISYDTGWSLQLNLSQGGVDGWSVDTWYHVAAVRNSNN